MTSATDLGMARDVALDVALASHAGPQGLADRRTTRLAQLLVGAAHESPLYRRVLKGRDLASVRLEELPVMHKGELMRSFAQWVTDPRLKPDALRRFVADRARIGEAYQGRYVVWESSGSTGEPGLFVQDASAMAVYDALEGLRRPALRPLQRLFDLLGLADRIAFVGATNGHFASTVSIERLRRNDAALARRLTAISFLQPAADLVAQLNDLAPTVIATYPSAALLLAEEREAGRLRVSPAEVWTGGEDLSDAKRAFVRRAFGCPVANSYGASEFLAIASECEHGRLHLNSDWVILEPVDAQGHAVPPGEAGATTLLTNLANHVQPLIRYDLGDRVRTHTDACACGSCLPAIEAQGRTAETLHLGRAGARAISVLPLALSTVLEEEAGLFDFQLVQRSRCDLLLRSALNGAEGDRVLCRARDALAAFLIAQGAVGVTIQCRSGETGRVGRSGKVQRVVALADASRV